jgi:hypothetical protein
MKRRDFLKTSFAASALAGLSVTAAEPKGAQEFYQLRVYRLAPDSKGELLHRYLETAAIPAVNRLGIKPVGVFTEPEPKEGPAVYALIPFDSLETGLSLGPRLRADPEYMRAGAEYLQTPKDKPAYARIDAWILRAFAGIPKLELPAYSREKKARIFELRTYESYSEAKAQKKVDMFNDGEIQIMRDTGLAPVFFGQALIGANLPHLTYMLSAESRDAHKQHWGAFGKHPEWKKMSSDPQYADTVSKITNHILEPAPYSQI